MTRTLRLVCLALVLPAMVSAQDSFRHSRDTASVESMFSDPPVSARPKALWPWVNGNFSLSQISYELREAKLKGMGGFDIWDVGAMVDVNNILPDGPSFLGDESLQAIAHTIREADELDLEIGLITSSSWNAGGRWIQPRHGAMGIYTSDTIVSGPRTFRGRLRFPGDEHQRSRNGELNRVTDPATGLPYYYREVAVIAYRYGGDSVLSANEIIDLERFVKKGIVNWRVPPGKWKVVRYVCFPTGQELAIPSPGSDGLVLDHFNAEAQELNMNYIFNRLKTVMDSLGGRSLKYLYEDSYEVNSGVWTPLLPETFSERYGYSLVRFLPALKGYIIANADTTERFLFDFSKLLSDMIIENHYAKGRRLAEREGLGFYAEAGGPGKPIHNVPFEDLKALGSLTVPRGEFWNRHPQLEKLQIVKGIASASHIYNQKFVEAESFTSVWLWQEGPSELKPLADRAMCEGLNRFVYHTFPHSPPESGTPGWIYNFGTIINTTNGWWPKSKGFHDYLARCSYLLQQGNFVGDAAFYYGDRAPNFVAPKHVPAELGSGYDYDVVNTDVVLNRMQVRDGRIYLPHGQSYAVLVLPEEETMDPRVILKLEQMVLEGITLIGPRPIRSYSLRDAARNDEVVREAASRLWGSINGTSVFENKVGKGRVIWGISVREALMTLSVPPDFTFTSHTGRDSIDYIHRITDEFDIYFIRNPLAEHLAGTCSFRVAYGIPEWWDPVTGHITPIKFYTRERGYTSIPLSIVSQGSGFVVFRKGKKSSDSSQAIQDIPSLLYSTSGPIATTGRDLPAAMELKGPWVVSFEKRTGSPVMDTMNLLRSWHTSDNDGIRHFSGQASYRIDFELPANLLQREYALLLELNRVKEIAEVYLNGRKLGTHWFHSNRFDITPYVTAGKNHLVIEVVNSINNMLIGDALLPERYRQTRSNISKLPNAWMKPFAEADLIEAGLIGPVIVRWARRL